MRYLLDANLSPAIADDLVDNGFDVLHVGDIGMLYATEEETEATPPVGKHTYVRSGHVPGPAGATSVTTTSSMSTTCSR